MGTKATGREIRDYYDEWPEGKDWYLDEQAIETHDDDGNFILELDKKYDLDDIGVLAWQGVWSETDETHKNLSASFRKWKKTKNEVDVLVTVPKDVLESVKATLDGAGLKYKVL